MGTVAIFLHGQQGDIMSAMSVLKYREQLWGDAKIVWYADKNNFDLFKFQDIEVREFPRGFGHPEMVVEENRKLVEAGKEPIWEDWQPLVAFDNTINQSLKYKHPTLGYIDYGYFPAPHQMSVAARHGLSYPDCSKKVFGIPMDWEWHPVLEFSVEEINNANDFIKSLPDGKKLFVETFAGSDQSKLSDEMIKNAMRLCRDKWPGCVFIFASHKYLRAQENFPENFFDQPDVFSCGEFTVRQCALIADYCNLIISVSSGLTVAASRWGAVAVPICQYTGSWICSTASLAKGRHFELVTSDNKLLPTSQYEFLIRLESLLNQYK